mmetsp:Transcript_26564/g.58213  ORF Transcript_26564/g.58213 Transcript_26564/m.58213 type:complete len:201 (+) Transcript_26564:372-974(+)
MRGFCSCRWRHSLLLKRQLCETRRLSRSTRWRSSWRPSTCYTILWRSSGASPRATGSRRASRRAASSPWPMRGCLQPPRQRCGLPLRSCLATTRPWCAARRLPTSASSLWLSTRRARRPPSRKTCCRYLGRSPPTSRTQFACSPSRTACASASSSPSPRTRPRCCPSSAWSRTTGRGACATWLASTFASSFPPLARRPSS